MKRYLLLAVLSILAACQKEIIKPVECSNVVMRTVIYSEPVRTVDQDLGEVCGRDLDSMRVKTHYYSTICEDGKVIDKDLFYIYDSKLPDE